MYRQAKRRAAAETPTVRMPVQPDTTAASTITIINYSIQHCKHIDKQDTVRWVNNAKLTVKQPFVINHVTTTFFKRSKKESESGPIFG